LLRLNDVSDGGDYGNLPPLAALGAEAADLAARVASPPPPHAMAATAAALAMLRATLEQVVSAELPARHRAGLRVIDLAVHGSVASGLALPGSDVDVLVRLADAPPVPATGGLACGDGGGSGNGGGGPWLGTAAAAIGPSLDHSGGVSLFALDDAEFPAWSAADERRRRALAFLQAAAGAVAAAPGVACARLVGGPGRRALLQVDVIGRKQLRLDVSAAFDEDGGDDDETRTAARASDCEGGRECVELRRVRVARESAAAQPMLRPVYFVARLLLRGAGLDAGATGGLGGYALALLVRDFLDASTPPSLSLSSSRLSSAFSGGACRDGVVACVRDAEALGAAILGFLHRHGDRGDVDAAAPGSRGDRLAALMDPVQPGHEVTAGLTKAAAVRRLFSRSRASLLTDMGVGRAENKARNLTIVTRDVHSLGAWHILPSTFYEASRLQTVADAAALEELQDRALTVRPVVLYLHGSGGNRASARRVAAYKSLADILDVNVVAVDYRGFGDSGGRPSEDGLAQDARAAWDYLALERGVAPSQILLLGHSLGAGVAARLAYDLSRDDSGGVAPPRGVVLLSPCASVPDAAFEFRLLGAIPLLRPVTFVSWAR
ncbi:hypothetical protein HK405_009972, partial [Cladochytrium tenue]